MTHTPLGEVCVALGLMTREQVDAVLGRVSKGEGGSAARFGELAIEMGLLDDTGLARALAQQFRLNMVPDERLERLVVAPEVLALLPARLMRDRLMVPTFLEPEKRVLSLVCADPTDLSALRLAQSAAQASRLRLFVAARSGIRTLIARVLPASDGDAGEPGMVSLDEEDELPHVDTLVLEPDPDRAAALRRLEQLEDTGVALVSAPEQVVSILDPERPSRIFYRRGLAATIDPHVPGWRRACPQLILCPVDNFSPTARSSVSYERARDFWLGVVEFVLLAGETRQMDARARVRRTARLARAMAEELKLPLEMLDAVAVASMFVDLDELSLVSGMLDESAAGRRFALPSTVLRQFDPPWDLDALFDALEGRLNGRLNPGQHPAAEVLFTARAAVRAGIADGADPVAAFGAEAARHDGRTLRALAAVLRRRALRNRVAAGGGSSLVVLAEREVAVLTALETRLGQAGFETQTAGDGDAVLQATRAARPAALVVNMRLPRKDGLSLLTEIRRDPMLRETPVFLISDTGAPQDVTRGLELGADDVLAKPINAQVVVAKLRRILARRPTDVPGIAGQLADMALPDLLQMLTYGGRTAAVHVDGAGETGVVQVREGRLAAANYGRRQGEEAFFALVGLGNGRFEVRFGDDGANNLDGATEFLLLEAVRRRDEARVRAHV